MASALALATGVAAFLLAVYLGSRIVRAGQRGYGRNGPSPEPASNDDARIAEIVLGVGYGDPDSPPVRRLAAEAGDRVLSSRPDLVAVRVISRDGKLLRLVRRASPATTDVSIPLVLLEPRHRHHAHVPSVAREVEGSEEPIPSQEVLAQRLVRAGGPHLGSPEPVHRTLTQSLDVPQFVKDRLSEPDSLVDLVRATLEAAGLRVQASGDMLTVGDTVVLVIPGSIGFGVSSHMLNSAYNQFRSSGAASGLVLTLGVMDHTDIRHRELFVPTLRHAGAEGVQRMLDAVALGGEPLSFAAPSARS